MTGPTGALGRRLGIGQRVTLGAAVLVLPLLVLIALALLWQEESSRLHHRLNAVIAPRAEASLELERRVFAVGVALRTLLLDPSAEPQAEFRAAVRAAREGREALAALPEPEGADGFARISQELDSYLELADQLAKARGGPSEAERDRDLAAQRGNLLPQLHDFSALQETKRLALRGELEALQEKSSRGLVTGSLVILLAFLGLAYAMAAFVRRPARELLDLARALEAGDFERARPFAGLGRATQPDDLGEVARALGSSAIALQRRERRLLAEGRVAAAASASLELRAIAQSAVSIMTDYVGGISSALYLRSEDNLLRPIASVALAEGAMDLRVGEGVPGHAVLSGVTQVVRDIPKDTPFVARFGIADCHPRTLVVVPLPAPHQVLGALVMASVQDLDADDVDFLERAARMLSVALQNAENHQEVLRGGAELQAQNEEIQAQNEELQAQGEELRRGADSLLDQDRRKDEFLALLAHEIRNPLAPIITGLEVLARAPAESEKATRAKALIDRQARHLALLADGLLDATRVARGKVTLDKRPLDLRGLLQSLAEDHRLVCQQHGLALEVALPDEPLWVDADRTRLTQVVGNLLQNAVKFTGCGGTVALTLEQEPARALLRVRDTGTGIEAHMLSRLFEPFTQAEATLDRTGVGLGLGLALVKGLVELHGGTVSAASEGLGKGAEFCVRLPLAALPLGHDVAEPSGSNGGAESLRVLVIEDNVDAAESLGELLGLFGHKVQVAHNGLEGLKRAAALRPDVVLCDIGLPGMSGYEVATAMRADESLRSTYLVALSGYAQVEDKARAKQAGFDLHLTKPATPERLEAVLHEVTTSQPPR
jgi:signal transduction histidine kinase/CheY-like chemotaxis protein/HAMP domain-containing protein